jgi:hypothetical protein
MNKEFVPYQQALELKKLGFDEPCFGYYALVEVRDYKNKGLHIRNEIVLNTLNGYRKYDDESQTLAPTFFQAFHWLLEKHNLYGIIIPTVTMAWTFKTMTIAQDIVEVPPYNHVGAYDYSSREEAEQACLEKLIELVKNK